MSSIGYARCSTSDQKLDLQIDALKNAGCEKIFHDIISGAKSERKGLDEALKYIRSGDTLVVWRLDRLGRSLRHLIDTVTDLNVRGVGFRSLQENIDTNTSGGKLVFHIFASIAEFERDIVKERTMAGLSSARARGRKGGRPRALNKSTGEMVVSLYEAKKHSIAEICKNAGISKPTLYRFLAEKNRVGM